MNSGRNLLVGLFFLFAFTAAGQDVYSIYSGPAPGTEDWDHEERTYYSKIFKNNVVTNVTKPTLTAFLPEPDIATGTAVVIAPGGAFHALSIDSEGTEVAKWLAKRGIAGFVLKYRLFPTGEDGVRDLMMKASDQGQMQKDMASIAPLAGADGLAALRYLRKNAEKFGIAKDRIGIIGFSAGGAVAAHAAYEFDTESRPRFVAPIYGGGANLSDAEVPLDAPPMFIVVATDDPLGLAKASVDLYSKWLEAKKPAELHAYERGGHGFGMKKQDLPSDTWIDRFGDWLGSEGLMDTK